MRLSTTPVKSSTRLQRTVYRALAALGVAVIGLGGVSACASTPKLVAGVSSKEIMVSGAFGEIPTATFPTPLMPQEAQCSTVIEGKGPRIQPGDSAEIAIAVFDASTGQAGQNGGFEGPGLLINNVEGEQIPAVFQKALTCASEGSRVVVVAPTQDFGGDPASTPPGVVVMDVKKVFSGAANGFPTLTRDGFPAVVSSPDGRVGITVPAKEAPKTVETETLLSGSGKTAESSNTAIVQVTAVTWKDPKVVQSTWDNQQPLTLALNGEDAKAIAAALVAQKVGTRIGVILPAGSATSANPGILGKSPTDETLFVVIDLIGLR